MTELQQVLQKLSELDRKTDRQFAEINTKFAQIDTKLSDFRGDVNTKFAEVNTKFAEINTKLSDLNGKFDTQFAKLEGKFDTKLAEVDTKISELKGEISTKSATLEGKVDNLPERIKLIEASTGKIVELSEKVGEGRGWRQLVQPFLTTLVTLLIGGGINWIMGVYRTVR
jgi:chromosome segregation ATPase